MFDRAIFPLVELTRHAQLVGHMAHYANLIDPSSLDNYSAKPRIQSRKLSIAIDNQNGRNRAGINVSIKDRVKELRKKYIQVYICK